MSSKVSELVDSNVVPCWQCGEMPVMIHDEFGFSCLHICGPWRMGGSWNYPSHEKAVAEWNSSNVEGQS